MRINSIDNKMSFGQKFVSRNVKKFSNSNSLKGLSNSPVKGLSENAKSAAIVTSAILNTAMTTYSYFVAKSASDKVDKADFNSELIEMNDDYLEWSLKFNEILKSEYEKSFNGYNEAVAVEEDGFLIIEDDEEAVAVEEYVTDDVEVNLEGRDLIGKG